MNVQTKPNLGAAQRLLPFERVALVLQGGGALGAYQAGAYEALAESRIQPDWIAGISIGGINAAIRIAGKMPADGVLAACSATKISTCSASRAAVELVQSFPPV